MPRWDEGGAGLPAGRGLSQGMSLESGGAPFGFGGGVIWVGASISNA